MAQSGSGLEGPVLSFLHALASCEKPVVAAVQGVAVGIGTNGIPYDVFANSVLGFGNNNVSWAWEGQGYQGGIYTITNMPNAAVFIILGTPQDSDDNGLTDAYELLVSHTNPYLDDQDGAGISDGWQVLLGLNPLVNQVAQPGTRANYVYTPADWLDQISGIKSGSVTSDAEGNVLQVSQ